MDDKNLKPVVSVLVLTYNQKAYIRQALDSVLRQKVDFPYEILIGDDASTDGTGEIVREYAKRRPDIVRAFIREQNLGGTKNAYDLLERARGTYIANCEGDDYWVDTGKLQRQVEFLQKNPRYSACTHAVKIVDESGKESSCQKLSWECQKSEYTLRDFKGIYLPGQPSTWLHRNFMHDKEHDYSIIYQAHPLVGDRTVAMILAMLGPIRREQHPMSCYRRLSVVQNSATNMVFNRSVETNQMQYRLTKKLEEYANKEFCIHVNFWQFKVKQIACVCIKRFISLICGDWKAKIRGG